MGVEAPMAVVLKVAIPQGSPPCGSKSRGRTAWVSIRGRADRHLLEPTVPRKDDPMRYTLLLHYPEMTADDLGEEALKEGMAAFDAYAKALDDARVLLSAEVLA